MREFHIYKELRDYLVSQQSQLHAATYPLAVIHLDKQLEHRLVGLAMED